MNANLQFDSQLRRGEARPVLLKTGEVGEMIAIAIVGFSQDGGAFSRAVTPRIMNGLPKELGHALYSFGTLVATDFSGWCNLNRSPKEWRPPLSGLTLGDWIEVEAFDEPSLVETLLGMCALHETPHDSAEQGVPSVAPRSSDEARFLESIRSEVSRRRPGLTTGFRRTFSLTGKNTGSEIDFVGSHYATCYAAINPKGKVNLRLQTASAALWRLARARDAFGFATPTSVELTAWVPPRGQPIFSEREYELVEETVAELREQAKREELGVFPATDYVVATDRLISVEGSTKPT